MLTQFKNGWCRLAALPASLAFGCIVAINANAQVSPPDLTVCEGVTCETLDESICSDAGFQIALKSYTPATTQNSGTATYVYEICSPPAGTCSNDATKSCLDNSQCDTNWRCQTGGPHSGTCSSDDTTACTTDDDCNPANTCSRACATDKFYGLSHFDVTFPELGGTESCLSSTNSIYGTCAVSKDTAPGGASVSGTLVTGDGSCFSSDSAVAKCDNTNIGPGDCITMTLNIAGETTGLGLGAAVVVDKEGTQCTSNCLAGPSCETCDEEQDGGACLTRTLGFWGTHPWITNDFVPVTVCGDPLTCNGAADGKSNPSCGYGTCNDVMEGLGSSPGQEGIKGQGGSAYVAMIKQLTAAKLNLNATAALTDGSCADWSYGGYGIGSWIDMCESLCHATESSISSSGCIEALNDFNNSEDVVAVTPAPFDRPPVDDYGHVSGADSTAFTAAQGNNKKTKLVIDRDIGTNQCGASYPGP